MSCIGRDSGSRRTGSEDISSPTFIDEKAQRSYVQEKHSTLINTSSPTSTDAEEPVTISDEKRSAIESISVWLDSHSQIFGRKPEVQRRWKTTFVRFGPLSGIFSMLVAIACIFASLGILAGSNHKPVKSWSIPPSTYLAIFTALANLSMRYAAIQGVVIAWWVKATKGSSLARLHWDYRSGTTLRGALTAGRYTGLLALASIFSTVVVIDGPLLQRSTSVVPAEISDHPIPLSVSMIQELPRDSTGQWAYEHEAAGDRIWDHTFNLTYLDSRGKAIRNNIFPMAKYNFMTSVIDDWASDAPLRDVVRGCPGTCNAKIRAPALAAVSCSHRLLPVNYSTPMNPNLTTSEAVPLYDEAFFIVPFLDVSGSHEVINLLTAHATVTNADDCSGYLNLTTCALRSAIGEYDVSIKNNSATLLSAGSPKIVALANNTQVTHTPTSFGNRGSTLAGLVYLVYTNFGGRVMCSPSPKSVSCYSNAVGPFQRYIKRHITSSCPSWKDPHADIRASFNSLMVYAGASATSRHHSYLESQLDPSVYHTINVNTTGFLTGTQNVFETWYSYFVGAVIVEIMCIALVLPTYWGWWEIGRSCSFSPLEIAKAFESPILAECNSNSSGRELANTVGSVRVRYGVITDHATEGKAKLAIAGADVATLPKDGTRFDA